MLVVVVVLTVSLHDGVEGGFAPRWSCVQNRRYRNNVVCMFRSVDWEVLLLCCILYIEQQEIDEIIEKLLEVGLYLIETH